MWFFFSEFDVGTRLSFFLHKDMEMTLCSQCQMLAMGEKVGNRLPSHLFSSLPVLLWEPRQIVQDYFEKHNIGHLGSIAE